MQVQMPSKLRLHVSQCEAQAQVCMGRAFPHTGLVFCSQIEQPANSCLIGTETKLAGYGCVSIGYSDVFCICKSLQKDAERCLVVG